MRRARRAQAPQPCGSRPSLTLRRGSRLWSTDVWLMILSSQRCREIRSHSYSIRPGGEQYADACVSQGESRKCSRGTTGAAGDLPGSLPSYCSSASQWSSVCRCQTSAPLLQTRKSTPPRSTPAACNSTGAHQHGRSHNQPEPHCSASSGSSDQLVQEKCYSPGGARWCCRTLASRGLPRPRSLPAPRCRGGPAPA